MWIKSQPHDSTSCQNRSSDMIAQVFYRISSTSAGETSGETRKNNLEETHPLLQTTDTLSGSHFRSPGTNEDLEVIVSFLNTCKVDSSSYMTLCLVGLKRLCSLRYGRKARSAWKIRSRTTTSKWNHRTALLRTQPRKAFAEISAIRRISQARKAGGILMGGFLAAVATGEKWCVRTSSISPACVV